MTLEVAEIQYLLERCWAPLGVTQHASGFTPEVITGLVRMTGGRLRLLKRLLTQIEHVLRGNDAQVVSVEIIQAARISLVMDQS